MFNFSADLDCMLNLTGVPLNGNLRSNFDYFPRNDFSGASVFKQFVAPSSRRNNKNWPRICSDWTAEPAMEQRERLLSATPWHYSTVRMITWFRSTWRWLLLRKRSSLTEIKSHSDVMKLSKLLQEIYSHHFIFLLWRVIPVWRLNNLWVLQQNWNVNLNDV